MPIISRFLGISIMMYYKDHNPPHFHVSYNFFLATVAIKELMVLHGKLPNRVLALVLEWANLHRTELLENWQRSQAGDKLLSIEPLI